jgi:hypothetical protein
MTHGQKTFRGSVVVNLDLTMLGALEQKLNVDFSKMEKKERAAFFKQNRISVVGILGGEERFLDQRKDPGATDSETISQLFEEASQQRSTDVHLQNIDDTTTTDQDDDLSRISELTGGPGKEKQLADFNASLLNNAEDESTVESEVRLEVNRVQQRHTIDTL